MTQDYDKNTNERGNNADTGNEKDRTHAQGDSSEARNQGEDSIKLDKTLTGSRTPSAEAEKQGQTENTTQGDLNWGFSKLWNIALEEGEQRVLEKREHLWASELYSAPIDVWLKMRAVPYSNVPNERSLRKFEAAHLMEWIISMLLKRAGILKGTEIRCEHQYEGLLKVTGRMDHLAGGIPDFESAKAELEALQLPPAFLRGLEKIITHLHEKYPTGLAEKPIEIKSVSSFAMDSMEKKQVSMKRHRAQLFHYLKSKVYKAGILVYLCRDDMRMAEFYISDAETFEKEYKERIEVLTKNHASEVRPPKEQLLVWDEDFSKFSKNFNVEYSNYLTMLYKFPEPRDYSEIWGKKATSWNRILKRVATGAKMTALNQVILEEIKAEGYNPDELAKLIPIDTPEEAEVISE